MAESTDTPAPVARIQRETVGDVPGAVEQEEKVGVVDDPGPRIARGGELEPREQVGRS